MKKLFDEVKLNNLTIKNRLVRSATWEGIAAVDAVSTSAVMRFMKSLPRAVSGLLSAGLQALPITTVTLTE